MDVHHVSLGRCLFPPATWLAPCAVGAAQPDLARVPDDREETAALRPAAGSDKQSRPLSYSTAGESQTTFPEPARGPSFKATRAAAEPAPHWMPEWEVGAGSPPEVPRYAALKEAAARDG